MLTLNKKSWHYWIATKLGDHYDGNNTSDLCSYIKEIIRGILIAILATAFGTAIGIFLLSPVYHFVGVLLGLIHRKMIGMEEAGVMMWGFIIIVGTIAYLKIKYDERKQELKNLPAKPPGVIKSAYRAWKDKVCLLITFKD